MLSLFFHLAIPLDQLAKTFMEFLLEAVLGEHDGVLPVVHGRLPAGLVHGIEPADLLGKPGRELCVLGFEGLETISTLEDKE